MHYVIYPDTLFMENLVCNLLFLAFLKSLFFREAAWKRILFAGSVGALCNTLVSILFFGSLWIVQIAVLLPAAGLMVVYCADIRRPEKVLYLLYQMVLWTLVLGGILQVLEQMLEIHSMEVICVTAFLAITFRTLEGIFRIYKRQDACMREVVLYFRGKSCHIRGLADTGNQLIDPVSKKPVSIITQEAWNTLTEGAEMPMYRLIPYRSVGNPTGLLPGVQIDSMAVWSGTDSTVYEKPMIAITEQPFEGIVQYSILLHNEYC